MNWPPHEELSTTEDTEDPEVKTSKARPFLRVLRVLCGEEPGNL
jgi:hypothetical protein